MNHSDLKQEMKNLEICEFCIRYFNKQFEFSMPGNEQPSNEKLEQQDFLSANDFIASVCGNCLGLSQLANNRGFLDWLRTRITSSGFEFASFNFNFKMPLSLKLRQRFVLNHLHKICQQKKISVDESAIFDFDLKLSIKSELNSAMTVLLDVPCTPNDDFVVNLEFRNEPDEENWVALKVQFV